MWLITKKKKKIQRLLLEKMLKKKMCIPNLNQDEARLRCSLEVTTAVDC